VEYYDEGGYGSIYKVKDKNLGSSLILKRSSKKDFVSGCLEPYFDTKPAKLIGKIEYNSTLKVSREAEFLAKIYEKLGGVRLIDYYDDDDQYILVMEDGGRSLESIASFHRKKILELVRCEGYESNFFYRTYLTQIVKYLIKIYHKIKSIHELGIHHNDLKPENILINGGEASIIDFGVAKPLEKYYEEYKGTLEYIPFEFVKYGTYKPWDHTVWCFGIMLHFLTLMKYPFFREEDVLDYTLDCEKINKLPETFSALIYDCLQKEPSKRPKNILKRLEDLQLECTTI
jgi:serine/threonine protein kinase